jgi:hypothetical protein
VEALGEKEREEVEREEAGKRAAEPANVVKTITMIHTHPQ